MALTLVTGRANSGKTGAMYEALRAAADDARMPVLLLPTAPDVQRAVAEFSHTHPLGIRVEQFDRWIDGLWSLHGDGRRPAADAQRRLLMAEAVRESRVRVLERSARTAGFVSLMSYVARSAAEEGRPALEKAVPRSTADAEALSLLRRYHECLDDADLLEPAEAARVLAVSPPPPAGPIFVHRFSDLTRSQEALLIALAALDDVWVSLPWEATFPASAALDPLIERLSGVAKRHHCPAGEEGADPELGRFEDGLFRAPAAKEPGGAVLFCTAAGVEAEASLIAERAAEAAARFGPGRVAIVFRDAARHLEHVGRALAGAGVPADLDVLVPAARTPFGRALASLLEWAAGGDAERLVSFLRGPFSGADPDEVDVLDARWRSGGALRRDRAAREAGRTGPDVARALALAARVCGGEGTAPAPEDWQELAGVLFAAAHGASGGSNGGLGPVQRAGAEEDAGALRVLLEVVSTLAGIQPARVGRQDVMDAFSEAHTVAGHSERPGHVQVTEAHRLRSRRFDAVIVGGLTSTDFSAEGRASAAAELADRLLGLERPSLQASERLLFYNVCTRAKKQLVLTRQTADSDGTYIRASVFWEEALDLYRPPAADASGEAESAFVAHAVRLSDLERAAPALTPGRAALRAAARERSVEVAGRPALARGGARRGQLRDPEVLAWLAAREEFSATELEAYARCPFRWFYEKAVRPEGLDVSFDALGRGDLAHRAIAAFYAGLPARLGVGRVTPEVLAPALAWMGEAFQSALEDSRTPGRATLAEEGEVTQVRAWVLDLVARDQHFLPGFVPVRSELRFGALRGPTDLQADGAVGDSAAPRPGPVDLGGFLLKGVIDRVDEGSAGLVITDYKTGAASPRARFGPDRVLQVPLYAAAAQAMLGRPVVAGLYRSLRSGSARGFWRGDVVDSPGLTSNDRVEDTDSVAGIIDEAVETARAAVAGIRAGAIPAAPTSVGACKYCAAASFCGRGV
jgi:ATP-dependent helicase/nuclease subunit B